MEQSKEFQKEKEERERPACLSRLSSFLLLCSFGICPALQTSTKFGRPITNPFPVSPSASSLKRPPPKAPVVGHPPLPPPPPPPFFCRLSLSLRSRNGEASQEQRRRQQQQQQHQRRQRRRRPRGARQAEAHAEERAPGVPLAAQLRLPRRHTVRI
jgi:hypothetical protein